MAFKSGAYVLVLVLQQRLTPDLNILTVIVALCVVWLFMWHASSLHVLLFMWHASNCTREQHQQCPTDAVLSANDAEEAQRSLRMTTVCWQEAGTDSQHGHKQAEEEQQWAGWQRASGVVGGVGERGTGSATAGSALGNRATHSNVKTQTGEQHGIWLPRFWHTWRS